MQLHTILATFLTKLSSFVKKKTKQKENNKADLCHLMSEFILQTGTACFPLDKWSSFLFFTPSKSTKMRKVMLTAKQSESLLA